MVRSVKFLLNLGCPCALFFFLHYCSSPLGAGEKELVSPHTPFTDLFQT